MGEKERDRRDRVRDTHAHTDGDSEWKKQQHKNGQQRGCYPGNNQASQGSYLTPMSFLAARRKEYLEAGESFVTLYCF